MPVFDFQEKRRVGLTPLKAPKSGVVSFSLTDVGDFLNIWYNSHLGVVFKFLFSCLSNAQLLSIQVVMSAVTGSRWRNICTSFQIALLVGHSCRSGEDTLKVLVTTSTKIMKKSIFLGYKFVK